jgi:1-acyl-sn-glycerol-3-phosphate acyltransferase
MIHIDRKQGRDAFAQVPSRAAAVCAMASGSCSRKARTPVGRRGKYKAGGSRLAGTKALVVPMAVNSASAGRGQLPQEAGVITVSIGKPISPEGPKPQELNERVENGSNPRCA